MIDFKNFGLLLGSVAEEKGLSKERILEAVEQALAAAYKKEFGKRGQNIKASLDVKTGKVEFWQIKLVVDEDMIYSEEELAALKEKSAQSPEGIEAGPPESSEAGFGGEQGKEDPYREKAE